jgi:hypothetical protein
MATTLQSWTANHPGVEVDGVGRWLVFKPCLKKARVFDSYFAAHRAALSREFCKCDDSHFIVELVTAAPVSRSSFARMVEQA